MTVLTHLSTLGLKPGVTQDMVKATYRELAKIHHPDRGGDERRMVAINAAWDALKDLSTAQLSHAHTPTNTGSKYNTKKPTKPGNHIFDIKHIRQITDDMIVRHYGHAIGDITKKWIDDAKNADPLSYKLHLPVRKMPKLRTIYLHMLDGVEVNPKGEIVYKLQCALTKGDHLFILPRLLVTKNGTSLRTAGQIIKEEYTVTTHNVASLTFTMTNGSVIHIVGGTGTAKSFQPHNADKILNENAQNVKSLQSVKKRMKGQTNSVWRAIAKTIRYFLELKK